MKYAIYTLHPWHDDYSLSRAVYKAVTGAARAWETLGVWLTRRRARQSLAELDVRLLEDIGLTPYEAQVEYSKPFWKP